MAQFDVYETTGATIVVDVQSDLTSVANTRVVIPLLPVEDVDAPPSRLNPLFTIQGQRRLLATHLMSAVARHRLSDTHLNLAKHEYVIKAAMDVLFSGY